MDTIDEAWRALRAHLEARARELADEVRHYPGPIARCDDQLPALIEERARAWELARCAEAVEGERSAGAARAWEAHVARFAWMVRPPDAAGAILYGRLVDALRGRSLARSRGTP
jgi:hypothetical protein